MNPETQAESARLESAAEGSNLLDGDPLTELAESRMT